MKQTVIESSPQAVNATYSRRSPAKALTHLMSQHSSGCAIFYDPKHAAIRWRVYFGNGQIHFAESSLGQQERLAYLLRRYVPQCKVSQNTSMSGYASLLGLLESRQLTPQQFRDLLVYITQEALSHLFAIPQVDVQFEAQGKVDPLILAVPLWNVVGPVEPRVEQWSLMYPEIGSAFERPFIKDWDKFIAFLSYMKGSYCRLSHLTVALKKNLCFYELANRFNLDVEDLAASIHPLIKVGAVGIRPYQTPVSISYTRVACIDQSLPVQSLVRRTLEPYGYKITPIIDTTQVFTVLAQQPPSVILLSSHLPKIDGYALCRLLRRVEALQDLPIVILDGSHRLLGGVRTQRCGSTATLPKPLETQALLSLIHQLSPKASSPSSKSLIPYV